jgi:hypothetical protein
MTTEKTVLSEEMQKKIERTAAKISEDYYIAREYDCNLTNEFAAAELMPYLQALVTDILTAERERLLPVLEAARCSYDVCDYPNVDGSLYKALQEYDKHVQGEATA